MIRALAALSVVISHSIEATTIWAPGWTAHSSPALALRIADATRAMGAWGVGIFFVLSGLCVHLPMARKLAASPGIGLDLRSYGYRRFWRIYPPHLIVIFLSMGAALVASPTAMVTVPTWGQFVAHLAMVHTFVPDAAFSVNHVLWSIALEAQFYLLYPLVLKARKKFPLGYITTGLFILGLAARGVDHYALIPGGISASQNVFGRFWEWTLGAVVAELVVARRSVKGPWWLWLTASFAIPVLTAAEPGSISIAITVCPIIYAIALIAVAESDSGAPSKWSAWLEQLGLRSYSLYLIHPIVFALLWLPLAALGAPLSSFLMLLSAVALSFGYFAMVEKPFMDKAARRPAIARAPVTES